jgi:hypothetical protein
MNNKIKYSILALSLTAFMSGMTSCSDSFLNVDSKTESTTGNFYKTETDAWRALIGCYDGWRQIASNPGIGIYVASTVMSDETYGATGNGDDRSYQVIDRFDINQSPSSLNIYEQDWTSYYAAVYRCNEFIGHEDQINWDEKSKRHEIYMGECRAIRALLYFDMVRFWGNIPLKLEASNDNPEQAAPADVYKAIFDDLNYAIENIPGEDHSSVYPTSAGQGPGHITKYACEAMKARAYLYYTGYYGEEPEGVTKADALAGLEDVIANGGYKLVENFKDLWPAASLVANENSLGWDTEKSTYAGDNNSEVVLAMNFTPTQDYNGNYDSNRWLVMMGVRTLSLAPYHSGWGACTVCPTYLNYFNNGDTRYTASVIDLAGEGFKDLEDFDKALADQREYTGYTVKKYTTLGFYDGSTANKEDGTADFQITSINSWVLMRYADVLLMAAELGSPNAQSYFDQVRERAGLASETVSKENIMKERAAEFAFEGIRYWDLLRQGVSYAAKVIAASSGSVLSGGTADEVSIKAENIEATKGLSQIPYNQITLSNGVLKQNAGW